MPTIVTQTPDIELDAAVSRAFRRPAPAGPLRLNAEAVIEEIGVEPIYLIFSALERRPLRFPEGDPYP